MTLKKLGIASAILLAGAQTAYANDLQINGFLNITAGVIDNEKIIDSPAAPGYDTTVGFDSQTLGGLQISKKVNDNTSATIQLMSRGKQDYQTEAAWAYVTYDLSDNTSIRFGRLRTPFFQYSDFLEVGYAYNWITPPGIVYRLDTMSALNGVDMTHQFTLGAMDGSFQLYTGRFKDDFDLDGETYEMELRSGVGAVLNLNAGNFGTRMSYHQAGFYINGLDATGTERALDRLFGLAQSFGLDTSNIEPQGQTATFFQGSLFWDNGSTSLVAEYTGLRHDSDLLNDDDAWMVSAAQRFGDFTTHLTYAYAEDKIKSGAIGTAQKFSEAQDSSITLGLRYDYSSSVAFKTEAHYITAKSSASRLAELEKNQGAAAGDLALDKNTGSLYTIGMSIVF